MRIYEFVREHVMPFNAVIVMSMTVAAVLDFLAPQAPYLAWVSYALATLALLAMVLEVQYLRSSSRDTWLARLLGRLRPPPGPLWKSPAWQVIGVIVAIALVLGQASRAKASDGGLIASAAPNLRNVQVLLLGIKEDTQRIQATLDTVDANVGSIKTSVEEIKNALPPSRKYDSPREALRQGDYAYLREYVGNGETLPASIKEGRNDLALGLNKKRPDRFQLAELYLEQDVPLRNDDFHIASLTFPHINFDEVTLQNVQKLEAWSQKNRPKSYTSPASVFADCKTTLLDYAYIAGDQELADWLIKNKGFDPDKKRGCAMEPKPVEEWDGKSLDGLFYPPKWTISSREIKTLLSR